MPSSPTNDLAGEQSDSVQTHKRRVRAWNWRTRDKRYAHFSDVDLQALGQRMRQRVADAEAVDVDGLAQIESTAIDSAARQIEDSEGESPFLPARNLTDCVDRSVDNSSDIDEQDHARKRRRIFSSDDVLPPWLARVIFPGSVESNASFRCSRLSVSAPVLDIESDDLLRPCDHFVTRIQSPRLSEEYHSKVVELSSSQSDSDRTSSTTSVFEVSQTAFEQSLQLEIQQLPLSHQCDEQKDCFDSDHSESDSVHNLKDQHYDLEFESNYTRSICGLDPKFEFEFEELAAKHPFFSVRIRICTIANHLHVRRVSNSNIDLISIAMYFNFT